jgi:hypothetical protein
MPGMGMARAALMGSGMEMLYAFVIIVCSLMIYYSTKELYEISKYKGIKYFRNAFLFFAVAYFIRFFIKFILFYVDKRSILSFVPRTGGSILLFIFMYASSMAIFYLFYSIMSKTWRKNGKLLLFNLLAVAIALITVLFQIPALYLFLNLILLAFIIYGVYVNHKGKNKGNWHIIYSLLSVFWLLNVLDILITDVFAGMQLFIYLASIGIFLLVLYKVLRKVGTC